jgi:hypothetical protein
MPTEVVTTGIIGPTGPAAVAPGSIITTRGQLIVGGSGGTAIALALGTSGKFLVSDGTDAGWRVIAAADLPTAIDAAKIANGTVSNTEFQYLGGVTSDIQTQLAAKAATAHNHITTAERGLHTDHDSTSTATPSDNTTSTITYAVAMDHTVTLPTGTWTVKAIGGLSLIHSASGTTLYRVSVDGQDSTARSMSVSSTIYQAGIDDDSKVGLSGSVHVYVHFRSSTAGTTSARNPWLFIVADRSA